MRISKTEALEKLSASGKLFTDVFRHGTLVVEIYKPEKVDLQKPHDRDEVYIVISGLGTYNADGKKYAFQPGDFLFAPAYVEHRFMDFSDDLVVWVLFYGPVGGESNIPSSLAD